MVKKPRATNPTSRMAKDNDLQYFDVSDLIPTQLGISE